MVNPPPNTDPKLLAAIEQKVKAHRIFLSGLDLWHGRGVPQDTTKAVEVFHEAADRCSLEAKYYLGIAYYLGAGVAPDKAKALELWAECACDRVFRATHDMVYVADRIKEIDGADKEHVAWLDAFIALSNATYKVKGKLFFNKAVSKVGEFAHYTSLEATESIVAPNGQFRLRNALYMDDREEGQVFFQIMEDRMKQRGFADYREKFYPAPAFNKPPCPSPAYLGSFVPVGKDKDGNKDRLPFWRSTYGKHGGIDAGGACLIYGREKFADVPDQPMGKKHQPPRTLEDEILIRLPGTHPLDVPALYRIAYKSDCESELKSELNQLADALKDMEALPAQLKPIVNEMLDSIRFLFKADCFKKENEMRVVQIDYAPQFYLELGKDFRCHEIIIGSNAVNYRQWASHLNRVAKGVKVFRSKIRFRQ